MSEPLLGMLLFWIAVPSTALAHQPCLPCLRPLMEKCCKSSSDCEVYVHYCKSSCKSGCQSCSSSNENAAEVKQEAATTGQAVYQPVVQASAPIGYPAIMPFPVMMPVAMSQQRGAPPISHSSAINARVDRLESSVKNLSERIDKIEDILNNNTAALEELARLATQDAQAQ